MTACGIAERIKDINILQDNEGPAGKCIISVRLYGHIHISRD